MIYNPDPPICWREAIALLVTALSIMTFILVVVTHG